MTPQSALREAEARLSFLTPPAGEAPSRVTTLPRAEPVGGSFPRPLSLRTRATVALVLACVAWLCVFLLLIVAVGADVFGVLS